MTTYYYLEVNLRRQQHRTRRRSRADGRQRAARQPVALVGGVLDAGTQHDRLAHQLGTITRAEVEARPRRDIHGIGDILRQLGRVDRAGIEAQAANPWQVPVDAGVECILRHARGFLAFVDAAGGALLLGVVERGARHQAQARCGFADRRQFQAAVALRAVQAVDRRQGIGDGVRTVDLEHGGAEQYAAGIDFCAQFILLGLERGEHFTGVRGRGWGGAAAGQARREVGI